VKQVHLYKCRVLRETPDDWGKDERLAGLRDDGRCPLPR